MDERTIHEIYTPAFKAGIDAGAKAVMTSYNLVNGEWCGESSYVINDLLRKQLGFQWMVMTDWWSVSDGEKVAASGQDLEMPYAIDHRHERLPPDTVGRWENQRVRYKSYGQKYIDNLLCHEII